MNRQQWASRPGRSSSWCRPVKRLALYMRSGFCCAYCGSDLSGREPRELALDHLNPKVNGGWHGARNLVLACRSCNCARKEMPWWEFAPAGAVDRIQKLRRRKLNYALARAIIRGDEPHPCPRFS